MLPNINCLLDKFENAVQKTTQTSTKKASLEILKTMDSREIQKSYQGKH